MTLTKNAEVGLRAIFFPFVVFLFHFGADFFLDAYNAVPQFDALMHLLGGMAVGLGMAEIIRAWQDRGMLKKDLHSGLFVYIAVAGTGLVAILWEFYEFLMDAVFFTNNQPNIADTMADFFLGLLGALIVSWFIVCRKKV